MKITTKKGQFLETFKSWDIYKYSANSGRVFYEALHPTDEDQVLNSSDLDKIKAEITEQASYEIHSRIRRSD